MKEKSNEERRIARKNKRKKNVMISVFLFENNCLSLQHNFSASELEELAKEARLLKQYKAGKVLASNNNNYYNCINNYYRYQNKSWKSN